MAIKREDLIPSILNKVRQTFNDNQGWVRQGKFTPKQQVQTFTNKMTDDTGLFRGNKFGVPNFTPLKALGDYSYKGGPTVREAFNKLPEQAQQDWGQAGLVRNNPLLQKFAPKAIEPLATAVELGPAAYMNTWSKGLTTFSRDTTIPEKAWDLLGVYGSLNPAYATKNLASGPLGVGFNAITNKVSGKPALENWKQGWQQGQEFQFHANPINQATGQLVNQLATKIPVLQKFTETALKSNIQPTDKLGTAVGKWLSTSGRKVLKAAVLETAVETPIWASMTKTDQETYLDALEREALQNLVMNVGMAGLNSLGDARQLAPIVKTSIDDAIQVYKNTPPQVTQGGYLNIFGNIVDGTSRTKLFDDAVYNLKENPNATPSDKGQATTNIINLAKRVLTNEEYKKIMSKKSGTYRGSTSAFDDLLDAVGKKIGSDIKTNKGYEEPFTINNLLSNKGKTREEILKSQSGKVNFFGDIDTKQSTEGFPQQNIKLKTNLGQSISPIKTGEVSTPEVKGVIPEGKGITLLVQEAKKYSTLDDFLHKGSYDATPISNSPENIKWNTQLENDIKGLDRTTLLKDIPVDKKGNFTVDPNKVIEQKISSFNQKYGANITRQDFMDGNINYGLRNDLLSNKINSQLTDVYNQAHNIPLSSPSIPSVNQPTIKITKAGENMPQAVIKIRPEQSGLDSSPFGGLRNQQPGLSQTPQRLYTDKGQFEQPSNDIIAQAKKQIGKASETPNKSIKQTADDIYTQWIDRYNPITKATDTAKKQLKSQGAELRPEFDPTYAVRRLTGAGGIADARFKTELEPIIKEMDNLGIAKDDIDVYLANRRIKGFGDIGRDVYGADSVRSAKVVSALENKYGDSIKQIAEKLYKYQDDGFDEMIRAGFISPETAKVIKSQNPDYAPLQRVMDEVDNYLGLPTRKTMQGSQPIVKLKGSTRQIDSPLENIIGNTFKQRAAIEKNNVASQIAGLQNVAELGFKKIAKSGNDTITVWKNGQKEYWQVGEEIADVAKGLNEENMNTLLKIFTAPASLLRQGATGRNPEFMVPNVIRDQLDAGITSRYGYIPFVDYLSGLKSMLKNDEIYQKWASSGAKIDLGELSGRKGISQYFDEKTAKKGLFSWLGSAMDTMGKYSEEPTRIGLFKKAYQKTGNELLAMMESRDATVDFARMGSKMKVANSIIPFLNVGIQGFDKLIRSVKNNPGKVLLNASIYGALPAITTTLYNLIYHGEEYNEIPSYERDGNFVLIKGRNEEGTVDYVTIPKGNVIPVIANPIQSLLEYMAGNSQQSFGQFATQFFSSTLPVVGEGQSLKEVAVKTVGSNMPQLIKPITENLVNKSFYKYDTKKEETKEIVPYYLKNKEPYQQSYKFTPSMYKSIGAVLNVSPLQVQNLMEGYLAGYTKIPANIIDSLKNISEGKDVEQNKVPILRRFIQETYPTSTTKTKPIVERTPLISQAQASEGGFLDKIFPNRVKTPEVINEIKYTNKNGNESTIKLSDVISMPEQTAYQRALKEKQKYTLVDDILDNLSGDQQIEALQTLGISSEDATYYNTAKQENYLKSIYVEDEIMTMIQQGQNKDQILNSLASMRKAVNEKILLSDGVINDLVDKNIISYADGKALKNIDKNLKPKKLKTKKAKKISLSSKKFTASKKKYNPLKVKSTKTKSRFTPPKYVKADLRTPTKLL